MTSLTLAGMANRATSELGSILVTVTVLTPDGSEVSRVYSTHPDVYPVGGRKRLDASQTSPVWLQQVIGDQRSFLGFNRDAVRAFFFDWPTIESLGCAAIVNTPVVHDGLTIGSINFLGPEGSLNDASVAIAEDITRAATGTVAKARAAAFPEVTE